MKESPVSRIDKHILLQNEHVRIESLQLKGADNETIGHAKLQFIDKPPLPEFCFVFDQKTEARYQNRQGRRDMLLATLNQFFESHDLIALSHNEAGEAGAPTRYMFQQLGWKQISNWPGWASYNVPESVSPETITKMIQAAGAATHYFEEINDHEP